MATFIRINAGVGIKLDHLVSWEDDGEIIVLRMADNCSEATRLFSWEDRTNLLAFLTGESVDLASCVAARAASAEQDRLARIGDVHGPWSD